jgi:hypothetical protein
MRHDRRIVKQICKRASALPEGESLSNEDGDKLRRAVISSCCWGVWATCAQPVAKQAEAFQYCFDKLRDAGLLAIWDGALVEVEGELSEPFDKAKHSFDLAVRAVMVEESMQKRQASQRSKQSRQTSAASKTSADPPTESGDDSDGSFHSAVEDWPSRTSDATLS